MPVIIAAILHMLVVKLNLFQFLAHPIDFRQKYKGKRIFGDNKTIRGIFFMVLFSVILCYVLSYSTFYLNNDYILYDFKKYPPYLYGVLLGLGYSLFELPNSFVKRQLNIESGKRGSILNILSDQADSVIGCYILIYPFIEASFSFIIAGIVLFTAIHLLFNFLLFVIGIRKNPM